MAEPPEPLLGQSTLAILEPEQRQESFGDDLDSFKAIYQKYLPRIYRYLFFRVGNHAEAEDLTSQVFIAAYDGLPRYQRRGSFAAWLFSIARNKAADHFRKRKPQYLTYGPLGENENEPDPLARIIHEERLDELGRLVGGLKEEEQELLRLRFAAEMSFDEIAALLKRRPSAVKMSLYRLLQRLGRQLERFQ